MSARSLDGEATVMVLNHLDGSGARGFVTTRNGGVSEGPYASLNLGLHVGDDDEAVIENRRRFVRSPSRRSTEISMNVCRPGPWHS